MKNLRKPIYPFLLATLMFIISCEPFISFENQNLTESQVVTSLIELNNIIISKKDEKLSEKELKSIYKNWLTSNNYNNDYKLPSLNGLSKINRFSNDVVSYIKYSTNFNEFQIKLIEMIDNDFKKNNNLKESITIIDEMRISNNYSIEEKSMLMSLSICVQFFDATLSEPNSYAAKLLSTKWQCYLSIAGMAINTAGLAAITGGASLLAMAGVVGGYTIEAILMVASCRCHFLNECETK